MDHLSTKRRWWLITRGLLRAAVTAALMVVLYYLLPLNSRSHTYIGLEFALGLVVLVGAMTWEVRAILRAKYPAIRAPQALATMVPLFLLVFASTYFILSSEDPTAFSEPLSRSDALYFTITVFSTVGFGDINPLDENVRLLVGSQMLLDLIVLGVGIKVILGAVQRGRDS